MKRIAFIMLLSGTISIVKAQVSYPVMNNPFPKTISVSGSAEMEIIPDEIYIQADLREYEKKGSGKINIDVIKTKFLASCKASGIPDSLISVASYHGADQLYWLSKKKKTPDMLAGISYIIKFSSAKKIDAFVENLDDEATQGFYIVKTSHSNIEALRKQLKIQAVKAAREKAVYLSEAIGEKTAEAISIQEPVDYSVLPVFKNAAASNTMLRANAAFESNTEDQQVDFKKIKLKFEVNAVFALR